MKYFPIQKSNFYKAYNKLKDLKSYALDCYDFSTASSLREMERDLFLKFDDFHEKWEFDDSKEIFFDLKSFETEIKEITEASTCTAFRRFYNLNNLLYE
jgi:hypothetical protein